MKKITIILMTTFVLIGMSENLCAQARDMYIRLETIPPGADIYALDPRSEEVGLKDYNSIGVSKTSEIKEGIVLGKTPLDVKVLKFGKNPVTGGISAIQAYQKNIFDRSGTVGTEIKVQYFFRAKKDGFKDEIFSVDIYPDEYTQPVAKQASLTSMSQAQETQVAQSQSEPHWEMGVEERTCDYKGNKVACLLVKRLEPTCGFSMAGLGIGDTIIGCDGYAYFKSRELLQAIYNEVTAVVNADKTMTLIVRKDYSDTITTIIIPGRFWESAPESSPESHQEPQVSQSKLEPVWSFGIIRTTCEWKGEKVGCVIMKNLEPNSIFVMCGLENGDTIIGCGDSTYPDTIQLMTRLVQDLDRVKENYTMRLLVKKRDGTLTTIVIPGRFWEK